MVVTPSRKFVIPGLCSKLDASEGAAISPAGQGGSRLRGYESSRWWRRRRNLRRPVPSFTLKLRRRLTGTETVNMCTVRVTVIIPRPIAIRECAVQIGLRVDCSRQGQRREELQTTENRMVTQSVARDVKLK